MLLADNLDFAGPSAVPRHFEACASIYMYAPLLLHKFKTCDHAPFCVMFHSEPWVGFKVVASGATSTNPWSTAAPGKVLPLPGRRLAGSDVEGNVAAKAQASGLYSFYQVCLRYSQLETEAWVRVVMLCLRVKRPYNRCITTTVVSTAAVVGLTFSHSDAVHFFTRQVLSQQTRLVGAHHHLTLNLMCKLPAAFALQDPNALVIGTQTAPANVNDFTTVQDCLAACECWPSFPTSWLT